MHQHALATDRGQKAHLSGADDRASAHRDVAWLDVVAGAADVGARPHAAQHGHPRLSAVGPPQRQHSVGEGRHRRARLHARGLTRLQPARLAGACLDRAHHREADFAVSVVVGIRGVVAVGRTNAKHIHAAHGVTVDGGLIEARQRTLSDDFLGAHQTLRFGDRHPDRAWRHRGSRYPGLLFLDRTHRTPI